MDSDKLDEILRRLRELERCVPDPYEPDYPRYQPPYTWPKTPRREPWEYPTPYWDEPQDWPTYIVYC